VKNGFYTFVLVTLTFDL